MTRMGERAMLPDFGSRIHDYVFELPDQTAENLIATEIVDALARWEPSIVDTEVAVDESGVREGKLLFNIRYTWLDTNNPNNLVFPYYLYEGVGPVSYTHLPKVLIGGMPAVDNTCMLNCAWGGVITVVNPGQTTVMD